MGVFRKKLFQPSPQKLSDVNAIKTVEKSNDESSSLRKAIQGNVLFASISPSQQELLIKVMSRQEIKAGDKQDITSCFCVVSKGKGELLIEGSAETELSEGKSFGELSLLHDMPQMCVVKATEALTLWLLEGTVFKQVIEYARRNEIAQTEKFLRSVPVFAQMTHQERVQVAGALELECYEIGGMVIKEGTTGDKFYVIKHGEAGVTVGGKQVDYKYKGDFFGEKSLLTDQPRNASITAATYFEILSLTRDNFTLMLGPLQEILDRTSASYGKLVLGGIPLLSTLSAEDRTTLAESLAEEILTKDQIVFKEGDEGDKLYIVKEGEVSVRTALKGEIDHLYTGEFFGERALLDNEPRMATVVAATDCTLLTISREIFNKVLRPLKDTIDFMSRRREVEDTRNVKDLLIVGTLGKGAFGTVHMVKHKETGKAYALKTIDKGFVLRHKYQAAIIREKQILKEIIPHPNVITLFNCFQDNKTLYMLMQLALGGELYMLLTKCGKFNDVMAKFYGACVVAAMSHLHKQNIIYRDLKPENMIIGNDGYTKLIDMGFARKMPASGQAYTLCGTPYYLSPEMIKHCGYDKATDWWTVGVLIYEMIAGHPPFLGNNELEVYSKVTNGQFSFTKDFSPEACDLVKQLLRLDPSKRLGNTRNGPDDIKAHPWFNSIKWEDLYEKKIAAPYTPPLKHSLDTSNVEGAKKTTCELSAKMGAVNIKDPNHWKDW